MIKKGRFLKVFGWVIGFAVSISGVWIICHEESASPRASRSQSAHRAVTPHSPKIVPKKPIEDGFSQVLAVFANGGTPRDLELAIETLDTLTRLGKGVATGQHTALLSAMDSGSPSGMSEGSWSHLFNSACNVLAVDQSTPDENLIKLLERIAVTEPRLVMRLYALQHLGVRYDTATPECQLRLRDLVQRILADPESQTAGTALVLWRRWEHSAGSETASSLDLSRSIVKDATRQLDVRVSALQAIGDDPGVLDLARAIAPDTTQPVSLRKVALNLIGLHGQKQDLEVLRLCSRESPRLAQAGDPAARSLQDRIAGHIPPVLQPY